jgi:hypothetical protein
MGYKTGKGGAVKIGANTVAAVQSWSLDVQVETAKGWGMGDAWQNTEATVKSWSGNVEAYLDPADAGQDALIPGATVTLELYPHETTTGAAYYTGSAVITGRPISAPKGDWVSVTFNFEGTGALTEDTVDA